MVFELTGRAHKTYGKTLLEMNWKWIASLTASFHQRTQKREQTRKYWKQITFCMKKRPRNPSHLIIIYVKIKYVRLINLKWNYFFLSRSFEALKNSALLNNISCLNSDQHSRIFVNQRFFRESNFGHDKRFVFISLFSRSLVYF